MSRLFDPAKRQQRTETAEKARAVAPARTGRCVSRGCAGDAVVAIAVVTVDGQQRTGHGSQFMDAERRLLPGVDWVRWVEHCSDCYSRNTSKAGRGVYAPIASGVIPTLDEARTAREKQHGK